MSQEINVPNHLGLILDGHRRWAKSKRLPPLQGHKIGYDNLKDISEYAFNKGVKFISAYIFSMENWNRSKQEVSYLMRLAYRMLTSDVKVLHKNNIRVVWLGSKEKVSDKLLKAIKDAEEQTKNNNKGTLCICFNYSGQQEIADALKKIIDQKTPSDKVDIALIEKNLYGNDIPKVDFLIRTSGEQRISNFMLWRVSYAELYFSNKYWPEFNKKDLDEAFSEYSQRERRFGK
jgi:undecaprenyl diphosphate synthase